MRRRDRRPVKTQGASASLPAAAEIEARLQSMSRQKIIEIVDKHPDEAVAILRRWLRRGD